MVDDSFVIAYSVQNNHDVALPVSFTYTDGANNEHTAIIQYNVSEGCVRFVIISLDDTYDTLRTWLDGQSPLDFKVCMVVDD